MIGLRPLPALLVVVAVIGAGLVGIQLFRNLSEDSGPTATPRPACPMSPPTATTARDTLERVELATVTTSHGTFAIELYPDVAPLATANFVALARCGFYDGIEFHRVLAGFLAQAGDPNTDDDREGADPTLIGSGGPVYRFEIEPPPDDLDYVRYSVSMANAGQPGSNGSQFFIALEDLSGALDRTYTIFGQVVEGTDVVDAIGRVPVDGPAGLPLDPVTIESISIELAPTPSPTAA